MGPRAPGKPHGPGTFNPYIRSMPRKPIELPPGFARRFVDMRAYFEKRSNGRTVQFDMAGFYTLKGGRITHIREILDTFDIVQQVLETDLGALLGYKPNGM